MKVIKALVVVVGLIVLLLMAATSSKGQGVVDPNPVAPHPTNVVVQTKYLGTYGRIKVSWMQNTIAQEIRIFQDDHANARGMLYLDTIPGGFGNHSYESPVGSADGVFLYYPGDSFIIQEWYDGSMLGQYTLYKNLDAGIPTVTPQPTATPRPTATPAPRQSMPLILNGGTP